MKNHLLPLARITNLVINTALLGAVFLGAARAYEAAGGDVRIVSTIDSGATARLFSFAACISSVPSTQAPCFFGT